MYVGSNLLQDIPKDHFRTHGLDKKKVSSLAVVYNNNGHIGAKKFISESFAIEGEGGTHENNVFSRFQI